MLTVEIPKKVERLLRKLSTCTKVKNALYLYVIMHFFSESVLL